MQMEQLAPKVETLEQLIELSKSKINYTNIDMKMLKRMAVHLEELNELIGLQDIKKSVCMQLLYYLSHFHLQKTDSFLYKNMKEARETKGRKSERLAKKRKGEEEIVNAQSPSSKKRPKRSQPKKKSRKYVSSEEEETEESSNDDYSEECEETDDEEDEDDEDDEECEEENGFSAIIMMLQQQQAPPKILRSIAPDNPNASYMNMVIYGEPGVGKSLVGSIIGKIFHSMDIFKTKNTKMPFRIIHSNDLVGQYLGQTAHITKSILEKSRGGVLMLDEAYSLNGGDMDRPDMYANNAVDTITAFLSENKDDICFILAGYKEDIQRKIFAINKGLESRFPWVHTIKGYTPRELGDIFLQKVNKSGWMVDIQAKNIYELFEENKRVFKNHARDVERLFNEVKMIHVSRTFSCSPSERMVINMKDLEAGIQKLQNERAGESSRSPPPYMYM